MAQQRTTRTRTVGALLGVTVALVIGASCGSASSTNNSASVTNRRQSPTKGTQLSVAEKEFAVEASSAQVAAGDVEVAVHNSGNVQHELVAFKTDLVQSSLPLTADKTRVDEAGQGITHLDPEAENVGAGSTKTITLHLTPGRYVLLCNLPAHYTSGMHTEIVAK